MADNDVIFSGIRVHLLNAASRGAKTVTVTTQALGVWVLGMARMVIFGHDLRVHLIVLEFFYPQCDRSTFSVSTKVNRDVARGRVRCGTRCGDNSLLEPRAAGAGRAEPVSIGHRGRV